MDIAQQLAQLKADPALTSWVLERLDEAKQIKDQLTLLLQKNEQDLHLKEWKIQALTLELAYHKRLKFSAKTESFTAQQCDLFLECEQSDLAAMQAEMAQLSPAASAPRKVSQTGRKALPVELPRIVHRHEPDSCTCGQ